MGYSPPSTLTALQRELLHAFFARERRFFLTGGGALAGFYFGHRTTDDLDFFSPPGPDLADVARTLDEASRAVGGQVRPLKTFEDFRRVVVTKADETCIVDLVIDRAPMVDVEKLDRDGVRLDTVREIAANKVCTLISRSEIKDLVDLRQLLSSGVQLADALADAEMKDGGADPATLAWVLSELTIGPSARLPGGVDPGELDRFRVELVRSLRALAFARVR